MKYVILSIARFIKGHHLDTSVRAILWADSGWQSNFWQAKSAVSRLVEERAGEGDVKDRVVGPQAQVDEDVGPGVLEIEIQRAAGQGPGRPVGFCGLVDVGA